MGNSIKIAIIFVFFSVNLFGQNFFFGLNKSIKNEWSVVDVTYDNISFYIGSQENSPDGLWFLNSTKFYICGSQYRKGFQYSLTTGWNVSTASYDSKSVQVALSPEQIVVYSSESKMLVLGSSGDVVNQYTMSTAGDISTATYDSKSLSVGSEDVSPNSIFLSPDETVLFMVGSATDSIYQYNLSTAGDISTATYSRKSLYVGSQESVPTGMAVRDDGKRILIVGNSSGGRVWQYSLGTAWNLSTGIYDNLFYDASTQSSSPTEIFIGESGSKMYIIDQNTNYIYQYSL